MFSTRELRETIILNTLFREGIQTKKELQDALTAHGVGYTSKYVLTNTIKALCLSLQREFKKHDIPLFNISAVAHSKQYEITREAFEFAKDNLVGDIYNEDGELESRFFQHPVVLTKEREMMI
tara:strand:- start:68 stop:436 length:369 start_codon:yes stop_codon:yes gene_type:complete